MSDPVSPSIGVIFDMDGVLVDSAADHLKSWQALARELGRDVTAQQFLGTFGRRSREIIALLFHEQDPARAAALDERKEAIYRDLIRGRVPEMPGAMALLATLHGAGFRLAVGSSGPPENVMLVCDELKLHPYLSAVVTGMDVTHGKPHPEVFLRAADFLQLPPARCVVVEDAPSGMEAARRADMACIALAGSHPVETLRAANLVIDRLDRITPALIHQLMGSTRRV